MNKIICCVAGRSGGHIIPCLMYAEYLKKDSTHSEILFFSTNGALDASIIKNFPSITDHIGLPLTGIPSKKSIFSYLKFIKQLISTTLKTIYWLILKRPALIVSTGGYIAVPVCIIGFLLRIRIELFELNAVPGKATLFLARYASIIHTCFPEAEKSFHHYKTDLIKYPIRFNHKKLLSRDAALKNLGFCSEKMTILILGGSQGSLFINNIMKKACILNKTLFSSIQIIHQTGDRSTEIKDFYTKKEITSCVFPYISHIEQFYPAADLIICRAGAGTLFETLFFKKPAIIIPLETAETNHQLDNALSMQNQYPTFFSVLRQQELFDDITPFIQLVQQLMEPK